MHRAVRSQVPALVPALEVEAEVDTSLQVIIPATETRHHRVDKSSMVIRERMAVPVAIRCTHQRIISRHRDIRVQVRDTRVRVRRTDTRTVSLTPVQTLEHTPEPALVAKVIKDRRRDIHPAVAISSISRAEVSRSRSPSPSTTRHLSHRVRSWSRSRSRCRSIGRIRFTSRSRSR